MTLEQFIDAATAWQNLGWAVQEQLSDIMARGADEESIEDQNPNAVRMIVPFLRELDSYEVVEDVGELANDIEAALKAVQS